MVEDAKAAQKVVDDKKAALDAAYAYAQQELASLKSSFATAQETIAKECADVKDSDELILCSLGIRSHLGNHSLCLLHQSSVLSSVSHRSSSSERSLYLNLRHTRLVLQ